MDFLTRPVVAVTHPSRQEAVAAPPHTTTALADTAPLSSPSTSQDDSSILTATSDGESAINKTSAAFSQLRTSNGDPEELEVPAPEGVRAGDWRSWSRVEARIVVWQDGIVRKSSSSKLRKITKDNLREESSWVVEGVVWVTRDHRLLFVIDHTKAPRSVALSLDKASGSPRRTSFFGGRRSSQTAVTTSTEADPAEGGPKEEGNSGEAHGIRGFVKKLFSSKGDEDDTKATEKGTDSNDLALTKTRSNEERGFKLERTKSAGHDYPHLPAPFPTCKGYSVTALHLPEPSALASVRYYPQKTGGSTLFSSSATPLTYPSDSVDTPKILSGGLTKNADSQPACVEIDVAANPIIAARKLNSGEEGKQREVTVGFYFLEALLTSEADELRQQLQTIQKLGEQTQQAAAAATA